MNATPLILHATTVARCIEGRWRGVLVRAPSGAGKSELALRALETGWRLVADDRTLVWRSGGALYARAPDTLSDLLEVRGLGIVAEPALAFARLALVLDGGASERMPDPQTDRLADIALPAIRLPLLEAASLPKLARALEATCRMAASAPTTAPALTAGGGWVSRPCAHSLPPGRR